jgi:hypothetical protein
MFNLMRKVSVILRDTFSKIIFAMTKRVFALAAVCFFFSCATTKQAGPLFSAGPSSFKNVMIAAGNKKDGFGPCEPSICINPSNPKNIAAGAILDSYYWSEDGGNTWQSGKLASDYGVFGDPVLIADPKGAFYYAHLSDPEGKQWGSEKLLDRIVIQKSIDGGKTYDRGAFCGENPPKDQDKHWLGIDPVSGAIYCTWTEFDQYESKDLANDHSRILFSKSTDGGKTWSPSLKINEADGDCSDDDFTTEGAVPVAGPNGEIYVAWAWNSAIWFDRSVDGGKTWLSNDIKVSDQPGGWAFNVQGISRSNGLPVTDCDRSNSPYRGTIYINWSDQRNGEEDTDIWLAKSTDSGTTWSKPVRVNNDKKGHDQFFTCMTIDQTTGYLYCVFYDRRDFTDKRTDVWLAVSKDGGATFSNIKISEKPFDPSKWVFFGDYNHISAHDGIVRPIWTRLENGVLSIWTAIINL